MRAMQQHAPIAASTTLGPVRLVVADVDRVAGFYEQAIGLRRDDGNDGIVRLAAEPAGTLVELEPHAEAAARPRGTTGLFHLAILVPTRADLARAVRRVVGAGAAFEGAADHIVSEALYLSDPEGNGIEIYRDRPREEWSFGGGELRMATLPLDLDGVMTELPADAEVDGTAPGPGTRIGHVHLQVADIAQAEAFWCGVVGFEVVVRSYPGALFVSAGGYHHHVGLNTWAGRGAPPPPPGARGLRHLTLQAPATDLELIVARAREAGIEPLREGDALELADPSGNRVVLRAA
jgi:catechol 2,3-dioxygenase